MLKKINYSVSGLRWHQWMNPLVKVPFITFTPIRKICVAHIYLKTDFFTWAQLLSYDNLTKK